MCVCVCVCVCAAAETFVAYLYSEANKQRLASVQEQNRLIVEEQEQVMCSKWHGAHRYTASWRLSAYSRGSVQPHLAVSAGGSLRRGRRHLRGSTYRGQGCLQWTDTSLDHGADLHGTRAQDASPTQAELSALAVRGPPSCFQQSSRVVPLTPLLFHGARIWLRTRRFIASEVNSPFCKR